MLVMARSEIAVEAHNVFFPSVIYHECEKECAHLCPYGLKIIKQKHLYNARKH